MKAGSEIRFASICFILFGLFISMFPHKFLPLGYIIGSTGAVVRSICLMRFHPEFYVGIMIILTGILYGLVPSRYLFFLLLMEGGALMVHGIHPMPVSYYTGESEGILILANYKSITAHAFYRETNFLGGFLLPCASLYFFFAQ